MGYTAFVVVNDATGARALANMLTDRGLIPCVFTDPQQALSRCSQDPPALVIVDDDVNGMRGAHFLSALLRISWSTSAILISDEDEDTVHEKTEGLGILGSIRGLGDSDGLARLLRRFLDLAC